MNEGKIWLYVSPTVGISAFFLVLVTAVLLVHASILTNTTWFAGYWEGGAKAAVSTAPMAAPAAPMAAPAEAAK